MKHVLTLLCLLFFSRYTAMAQGTEISGNIKNKNGEPIPGAVITLQPLSITTQADANGNFRIQTTQTEVSISITMLAFQKQEFRLKAPFPKSLNVTLLEDPRQLQEVVISSGYQQLSKERATGAFEQFNTELLERNVSSGILERLDGLNATTLFDKRSFSINAPQGDANILIRGVNTINANRNPLIILDNFPFEGELNSINPNDIASVSILKDAAAASIWGARAGNGVIVITTKRGKLNQSMQLSFNNNINITAKPRLFDDLIMSSSDYIDNEIDLFARGYFTSLENNVRRPALSPVVELLIARREGRITEAALNSQINNLKQLDVRNDYLDAVYRREVNQQYALNLKGGSAKHSYFISAGYDKGLQALSSNSSQRSTLRMNNSYKPLKGLDLQSNLQYSFNQQAGQSRSAAMGYGRLLIGNRQLYPYARLINEDGSPAIIEKDFRSRSIAAIGNNQLLDWNYRPLDELNFPGETQHNQTLIADLAARYQVLSWLSAELKYQYQQGVTDREDLNTAASYFSRNLINRFSQVSGNLLNRPIPLGGILDEFRSNQQAHSGRAQLGFDKAWTNHEIHAIAGAEIRQAASSFSTNRAYGYDENVLTAIPVDYVTLFPGFQNLSPSARIPYVGAFGETLNRYVSYYANAAYTYQQRYTISASVRKDASNIFGVRTNEKGVPLWSAGALWNIAKEDSYGFAGNIDNSLSALTTLTYFSGANPITNLPYANISSPPNGELRWEKVGTFNAGIDFASKNNRISGSFDIYSKRTTDLLGIEPANPFTGFTTLTLNGASSKGSGWELQLNSLNTTGKLAWTSNLSLAHSRSEITRYKADVFVSGLVGNGISLNPVENYPVFPLFSYRWRGLDEQNGDPVGELAGVNSKDYAAIVNNTPLEELVLHGSAIPLYNGAFRNTLTYGAFSLSMNITFRLDYYFRSRSISYTELYANGKGHADYAKRWQQAGDEAFTQVPSKIYPAIANRDIFYNNSEITVSKGDHIRLQDIRFGWQLLPKPTKKLPFRRLELFTYTNNLGIIWRASEGNIDPDYGFDSIAPSAIYALGLRAEF
ncbi:TonB-dependent receptor SusC [Pedobacter glucosidilyticus]|nr:SusC/RagA family TonB-linked outer membrane protein [Pedobacter glucosidilyticus]KHJ37916.1 TonB-dependent receptor SusC [Pedobacter glucosidilyticus]